MKEKIILITMLVSILLVIFLASAGLKIGNFQILSFSQLKEKNQEVSDQIDKVSELTSVDYPAAVKQLEDTTESLQIQKEKYEQLAGFAEEEDGVYVKEQFDISYLWTKIGKYATRNKIGLVMNVRKSSGTGYYNLEFAITGEYVDISQFVATLENDSELTFRIYNFVIDTYSADGVTLKANFTVKDVNLNEKTLNNSSAQTISTTELDDRNNNTTTNNTTTGNNTVADDSMENFVGEEKTENGTTFNDLNR